MLGGPQSRSGHGGEEKNSQCILLNIYHIEKKYFNENFHILMESADIFYTEFILCTMSCFGGIL
jgi:hypothetical protein